MFLETKAMPVFSQSKVCGMRLVIFSLFWRLRIRHLHRVVNWNSDLKYTSEVQAGYLAVFADMDRCKGGWMRKKNQIDSGTGRDVWASRRNMGFVITLRLMIGQCGLASFGRLRSNNNTEHNTSGLVNRKRPATSWSIYMRSTSHALPSFHKPPRILQKRHLTRWCAPTEITPDALPEVHDQASPLPVGFRNLRCRSGFR
jgi:hypothetical protein